MLAVETTFGIDISNEEAERSTTVGALYEVVLSKIELTPHASDKTGTR
ncbi:MAG: hypothetical protein WDO73_14885 [Ignavibacteriota bacterium]